MPCNLNRLVDEQWFSEERSVEFECRSGGVHWFHGARLVGIPSESSDADAAVTWRLVCHLLIDHIADAGMPEVCQSLRDFYDYYKPAEEPRYLPEVRSYLAMSGSRTERPAFTVEGE